MQLSYDKKHVNDFIKLYPCIIDNKKDNNKFSAIIFGSKVCHNVFKIVLTTLSALKWDFKKTRGRKISPPPQDI